MPSVFRPLEEVLRQRLSPEAASWFGAALEDASSDAFLARWSGAGRRLGRTPVAVPDPTNLPLDPTGWGADELGRALLLLRAVEARPAATHLAFVEDLYRTGEIRERQAVLRVLGALPEPGSYLKLAVDSVRANVLSEIEAIACENPYPARHFTDEAFNQMVLKCLFNGVALGRVQGLAERRGAELERMVAAYAAERRAAGRSVPPDVALVLQGG
jgi:hypothetical protein